MKHYILFSLLQVIEFANTALRLWYVMINYLRTWSFRVVLLLYITKPKWKYGCTTMLLLEKHMFLQINKSVFTRTLSKTNPDSKIIGANMGPTWVLSAPNGPMLSTWTLLSGMNVDINLEAVNEGNRQLFEVMLNAVCIVIGQCMWSLCCPRQEDSYTNWSELSCFADTEAYK